MALASLIKLCLIFLLSLFGTRISLCESRLHVESYNFETLKSVFLEIQPFFTDSIRAYPQCCNLCAAIDKCASFNYDMKTHLCSLLPESTEEATMKPSPSTVHGKFVKKYEKKAKGKCTSRPCKSGQVCVTTTSGHGYICLEGISGIDCGHPPAHDKKHVTSVTSTLYPARVEYTCDPGYNRTEGNQFSSCQANGTWSVPTLKCEAVDCKIPVDMEHMEKTVVSGTTYMSQVTLTCSTGFTSDGGDPTIECLANGTWAQPTLVCKRVDCGRPPAHDNKHLISVTSSLHPAKVDYTCDDGYNRTEGSQSSTCQANGTWSVPTLKCEVVDCGTPPHTHNHGVTFVNTTYQSVAMYQCDLGYYIPGNGTSACQADGQWSETCQEIPNLRGLKILAASSGTLPQCRNVLSVSYSSNYYTYLQIAKCDGDEILSGCSAFTQNEGTEVYGPWVDQNLRCVTAYNAGARSVARCCKIPGIQCEYIRSVTSSASCYKNLQLLDCSCSSYDGPGYCLSVTNSSCDSSSTSQAYRYAVCCIHDELDCYVKEVSVEEDTGIVELATTCGGSETMTACSGFNADKGIHKALVEVRNGVDTCVVHPGPSSLATLKAYVSCCKYK